MLIKGFYKLTVSSTKLLKNSKL